MWVGGASHGAWIGRALGGVPPWMRSYSKQRRATGAGVTMGTGLLPGVPTSPSRGRAPLQGGEELEGVKSGAPPLVRTPEWASERSWAPPFHASGTCGLLFKSFTHPSEFPPSLSGLLRKVAVLPAPRWGGPKRRAQSWEKGHGGGLQKRGLAPSS
jgi:hypothetical protein